MRLPIHQGERNEKSAGGFPYKITQQGSYKLSGNLVVTATNTDAIDISAGGVTLDLNGFSITGPVTCTELGAAVSCTPVVGGLFAGFGINASGTNITVRNGTCAGFAIGVEALGQGVLVEEVHASSNSAFGISVSQGVARRNTAYGNGLIGINALSAAVSDNIAENNGGNGITACGSVVTENASNSNGFYGLSTDVGTVVFGGNTFQFNSAGAIAGAAASQNNNNCNGSTC